MEAKSGSLVMELTCRIAGIEQRAGTLVRLAAELIVAHAPHIDKGLLLYGQHLEVRGYHDALRLALLFAAPNDLAVIDAHPHLGP